MPPFILLATSNSGDYMQLVSESVTLRDIIPHCPAHYVVGFNIVHYLKYFQDVIHCKTVETVERIKNN